AGNPGNGDVGSNGGTVRAVTGGTLSIDGNSAFTNTGTLSADGSSSTLSVGSNGVNPPAWHSSGGIISVTNGATLNLGNQFTQADLTHFSRGGGTTVNLKGTLAGGLTL